MFLLSPLSHHLAFSAAKEMLSCACFAKLNKVDTEGNGVVWKNFTRYFLLSPKMLAKELSYKFERVCPGKNSLHKTLMLWAGCYSSQFLKAR
jgi:hypothetical protein